MPSPAQFVDRMLWKICTLISFATFAYQLAALSPASNRCFIKTPVLAMARDIAERCEALLAAKTLERGNEPKVRAGALAD
jgi:hypothetical protein